MEATREGATGDEKRDWLKMVNKQSADLKQVMDEIARIGSERTHQGPMADGRQNRREGRTPSKQRGKMEGEQNEEGELMGKEIIEQNQGRDTRLTWVAVSNNENVGE